MGNYEPFIVIITLQHCCKKYTCNTLSRCSPSLGKGNMGKNTNY